MDNLTHDCSGSAYRPDRPPRGRSRQPLSGGVGHISSGYHKHDHPNDPRRLRCIDAGDSMMVILMINRIETVMVLLLLTAPLAAQAHRREPDGGFAALSLRGLS